MSRAFVTGGTGFIGSHLVEALLARGDQVVCAVRERSDLTWLEGIPAERAKVDFESVASVAAAMAGAGHVYHLAGVTASRDGERFVRVNMALTARVAEAAATQPKPPRFLLVSSLSAAGPSRPDEPLREEMPARPISIYGRSKLAGEEAALALASRLEVAVVRPPVVYGPRDRGMLSVFQMVKRRINPRVGGPSRRVSLIAVEDLVAGLLQVMAHPGAAGRTYYLAHPETLSLQEVGQLAARALGLRTLNVPAPDPLVKLGGLLSEKALGLIGRDAPFNRDKAREMTQAGWVCHGGRAAAELGFAARTSHSEGFARTAAWYRERGWL